MSAGSTDSVKLPRRYMRLWRERWRAFSKGVPIRQIRAISKAYRDLRSER